jgi:penicillin-binding protein 1A
VDCKILGTYYIENRNVIEYKDLSPHLVHALISREDRRFYKHSGIDFYGLMRVFFKTVICINKAEGGGSTITQQLAKNLFPRDTSEIHFKLPKTVITKFKEWIIAVRLENRYTKEEIITMYLNVVSFGNESYGIKTAARTYFNKPADALNIEEAALLIGMLKSASMYDPRRNTQRALRRRNSVFNKMLEQKYLTKPQFDSLKELPIVLNYQPQSYQAGLATHLREHIRYTMNRNEPVRKNYKNYLSYQEDSTKWDDDPLYGWCSKNLKPDGTKFNLYKDGLKIYTTIDSRMQQYAEKSLTDHLSKTLQPAFFRVKKGKKKAPYASNLSDAGIRERLVIAMRHSDRFRNMKNSGFSEKEIEANFYEATDMRVFTWKGVRDTTMSPWDSIRYSKSYLRASFMAMDPHNGHIKAYVGGPDIRFFRYDGVMMQRRQVGSTIKPFLYTVALKEGYTPCDLVWNTPVTFKLENGSLYTPQNDEPTIYDGKRVTLTWGLSHSVNNTAAYLFQQFKYQPLVDLLRGLGIKSDIPDVPSIFLGTPEFSVCELIAAYSVFPNKGFYTHPIFITKIEDKNGNVLSTFISRKVEIINETVAYTMTQMLTDVVKNGTAMRIPSVYHLKNEIGGKTGTTQNQSDGWFVGVTPDLVAGAWVGGDEPSIHFDRMSEGQGASMALPIFGLFMQKVYADQYLNLSQKPFEKPEGYAINFDCPMSEVDKEANKEYLEDDF